MQIKILHKKDGQKITLDQAQINVLGHLEHLQKQLHKSTKKSPTRLAIKKIFSKTTPIKSIYIYGQVGRGKSMLMRHFFENLPTKNNTIIHHASASRAVENQGFSTYQCPSKDEHWYETYFHFNNFMQEVHKELHKLRKIKTHQDRDLIALATKKIIGNAKVLCFDEMQVEDVADAMILQGVFNYFIQQQIVVVTTSNCHPLELYENGLQRDLFLKFINEVLLQNFTALNLDGKIDYRGQFVHSQQHYFYPINAENKKAVLTIWDKITDNNAPQKRTVETLGRKIVIKNSHKNAALFDFKELCEADLGVADYQAITKEFSLIFLLNVPILKPEDRNEAKRLIWFIDEIYEAHTQLIVLAESKPEEIYVKGIGTKAFKRTASRLSEM